LPAQYYRAGGNLVRISQEKDEKDANSRRSHVRSRKAPEGRISDQRFSLEEHPGIIMLTPPPENGGAIFTVATTHNLAMRDRENGSSCDDFACSSQYFL